jgi:hypothetical protein
MEAEEEEEGPIPGLAQHLPDDLCNIIMKDVQQDDPLSCLYLAITCKREYNRYRALGIYTEQRTTLRDMLETLAAQEGTLIHGCYIPTDPEYRNLKKREEEWYKKFSHGYVRRRTSEKRAFMRRGLQELQREWKRGVYDSD